MDTPQSVRRLVYQYLDNEATVAGDNDNEESGDNEPSKGINLDSDEDNNQPKLEQAKGRKPSWVWQYFKKLGKGRSAEGQCLECKKEGQTKNIKRHDGSTRDLITHLRSVHGISKSGRMSLQETNKETRPYAPRSRDQAEITWCLTQFIVINKRPFHLVESPEFKALLTRLNPRYTCPSRKKIKHIATVMHQLTKKAVKEVMTQNWQYYPSYTCDMWTAANASQFISLQLHLVDGNFDVCTFSTGAVPLPPPHNATEIASCINSLLEDLGFPGTYKITSTTDWGQNVKVAVDEILNHDWLPCFAHVTHNVLNDLRGLDKYIEIIGKARAICAMFRTSPKKWEQLRQIQLEVIRSGDVTNAQQNNVNDEQAGAEGVNGQDDDCGEPIQVQQGQAKAKTNRISPIEEEDVDTLEEQGVDLSEDFVEVLTKVLRLKIDVATRWSSIYQMLQRLVSLKQPVEIWFTKHDPHSELRLNGEEWIVLYDILDLLGILKELTTMVQDREDPIIVHVLPQLLRMCTKYLDKPACTSEAFSGRTLKDIKSHLGVQTHHEVDLTQLVSGIQKEMLAIILHGYFGEKGSTRVDVQVRKAEGRLNSFFILYAWAICSIVDPSNLIRWNERIDQPLMHLVQQGYLLTAYEQTKQFYCTDILGEDLEEIDDQQHDKNLQSEDEGQDDLVQNGGGTEEGGNAQQLGRGGRKRKKNPKYSTATFAVSNVSQPQRSRKRKKVRKPPATSATVLPGFGVMLKELAMDELKRLGIEAAQHIEQQRNTPVTNDKQQTDAGIGQGQGASGSGGVSNYETNMVQTKLSSKAGQKVVKRPFKKGIGDYTDDEEDIDIVPIRAASTATPEEKVQLELSQFMLEPALGKHQKLLGWWKLKGIKYPILSLVARRLLAVKATSAEAERDFSHAGIVASKQRQQLNWESMEICTFCSLNSIYVPNEAPPGFVG